MFQKKEAETDFFYIHRCTKVTREININILVERRNVEMTSNDESYLQQQNLLTCNMELVENVL